MNTEAREGESLDASVAPEAPPGLAGRVTLEEVAELAGVSRATASRVINGSPRVSSDARRAVERAAAQLGYVPNRAARSLVTRRSDSIGLVIPEPTPYLFADPYFPHLVRGVGETLAERDVQLVLFMPQSRRDEHRLETYLAGGHVDGVLLVSLHDDDPLPQRLAKRGIPAVLGDRRFEDADLSYVDVDNQRGAMQAVAHLAEQGRKRIALVSGPHDMVAGIDRLTGYRQALADSGLPHDLALEEAGNFTYPSGVAAMNALLERCPDLDAVFAASDAMALGAMTALLAHGRRIPDDVAVVGFDDLELALSADPPLSSVRQPIESQGREMARLLLRIIGSGDRTPTRVLLGTELIVRASSGRFS
jgi:DNA-binding LacI/PurR family transcriptional regulator